MTDQLARLDDLVTGVLNEFFRATQAEAMQDLIGAHADACNAAGYGELLGTLQDILAERYTLSMCKIFERSNQHPTRSLPVVLDLLELEADALEVRDARAIERSLSRFDPDAESPGEGPDLTRAFARAVRRSMPDAKNGDDALSKTLRSLQTLRHKYVAHSEHGFDPASVHHATWPDGFQLLILVKRIVIAIGPGYLGTFYGNDVQEFPIETDAGRVRVALRRLLTSAGVPLDA